MDESPPFTTATVGRIYLEQGKLEQAEEVFRRVLAERPKDERCLQGLAEIARRRVDEQAGTTGADSVSVEAQDGALVCRFSVSTEGRRRARLVSGHDGALVLRIVRFPAVADTPPVDAVLPGDEGLLRLQPPEGALFVAAAVGLLAAGGAFVAIAHSTLISLV